MLKSVVSATSAVALVEQFMTAGSRQLSFVFEIP